MARALLLPMYQKAARQGHIHFHAYSPGQVRAKELASEIKGKALPDLKDVETLRNQDYYFVCCKPQQFPVLASQLRGRLNPYATVVSILAGTSLRTLSQGLEHSKVVRLMPNTPAIVQAGVILFLSGPKVENKSKEQLLRALSRAGKVFEVKGEDQLDRVTGYTGSGPAYLFELARILSVHLQSSCSLSIAEAQKLMIDLFWGAAKMMKESSFSPEQLRIQVTSPGGVTAEALKILQEGQWENLFQQALEANYRRAKELAEGQEGDALP